jgi:NAD-dependent deacetylase
MKRLIVLSGAGLSAPSGVSTFRDKGGLWTKYDLDEVCNGLTWRQNREKVHEFYNILRTGLHDVQPTAGHHLIASWKRDYGDRAVVLTQNVDDLLERAGCMDVVHLHGFLQDMRCIACGNDWNIGYGEWNHEVDRCPQCHSVRGVKPGVVFFNDSAPRYADLYRAFKNLSVDDTVVIIGTSGEVINVNSLVFDKLAFAILNNMEKNDTLNERYFNKIFYESVETAAPLMDAIVRERMS